MSATTSAKPTSPRAWAALILEAGPAMREQLLAQCPADWRELVLAHVRAGDQRVSEFVATREQLRPQAKPAAPTTIPYRDLPRHRGNPAAAAAGLAAARAALNPTREVRP